MATVYPEGIAGEAEFALFLKECRDSAQRGYGIATGHEKVLSRTLREAESEVQQAMDEIAVSLVHAPDTIEHLQKQLFDIQQ